MKCWKFGDRQMVTEKKNQKIRPTSTPTMRAALERTSAERWAPGSSIDETTPLGRRPPLAHPHQHDDVNDQGSEGNDWRKTAFELWIFWNNKVLVQADWRPLCLSLSLFKLAGPQSPSPFGPIGPLPTLTTHPKGDRYVSPTKHRHQAANRVFWRWEGIFSKGYLVTLMVTPLLFAFFSRGSLHKSWDARISFPEKLKSMIKSKIIILNKREK